MFYFGCSFAHILDIQGIFSYIVVSDKLTKSNKIRY